MTSCLSPDWIPTKEYIANTNIAQSMRELDIKTYKEFHRWSVENYNDFWDYTIKKLAITFQEPYQKICDLRQGIETPIWLPKAKLNITQSCFKADKENLAIIFGNENNIFTKVTYDELNRLSNRVANGLEEQGYKKGDMIAIYMPMNIEAVAIYLGIIKAGCIVVSIASSFSVDEINSRLKITGAKAIFTQDVMLRNNKKLPLYEKVCAANSLPTIVIPFEKSLPIKLRESDLIWSDFLTANEKFTPVICEPNDYLTILFSSGTTGEPKAIPWTHTTPIKCASDAFYHHDIKPGDVIAWPSDLGWMMGPWLIYASLINKATMALFDGAPTSQAFGIFVQNAHVEILGLVPSLVSAWRASRQMEGVNWSSIKLFSSSGECSNPDDMLYLMSLANNKPIIEYCGGTEIGGAYITSTTVEPNIPSTFTTPTLGLDFVIIDDNGNPTNNGEVALVPPSIGLSNELLNRDHYQIYFADMPKSKTGKILRRHGDQIEKINENYYRALGRVDDTMNLGGIKTSSAEIERSLTHLSGIKETAAIAVSPKNGGPSLLVIYVVLQNSQSIEKITLQQSMQKCIKENLNPLFKIHEVVLIDSLPRTASNKIMRRVLRNMYEQMK